MDELPATLAKRLPHYPVPAAVLGRLAIDRAQQRRGLGETLLLDAIRRVVRASTTIAVYAIIVDAKNERARAASIMFSHRGCIRKCDFCAVPILEGKPFQIRPNSRIAHLVHPDHKRVILWDNNVLGESHWRGLFAELKTLKVEVDFNQGLDARLVTKDVAVELNGLNIPTIRFAYDFPGMQKGMQRAITHLRAAGLSSRRHGHIICYVLYNHRDTPEELFERVRDLLAWGIAAYPMRYQPLGGEYALEKDPTFPRIGPTNN